MTKAEILAVAGALAESRPQPSDFDLDTRNDAYEHAGAVGQWRSDVLEVGRVLSLLDASLTPEDWYKACGMQP